MTTPRARRLDCLFTPRSVALIGASDRSVLAKTVWESVLAGGYSGRIHPVNPGRSEVFGVPCYASIDALPEPPDLCLIAVSEKASLDVLKDCEAKGAKGALLYTLFSPTAESQALRAPIKAFVRDTEMVVCGSGTFGLIDLGSGFMPLLAPPPAMSKGNVALVCQSGGILNSLLNCLRAVHTGISTAVSTGGEDQLGAADYIDYIRADGRTRVIGCVIEQIKDIGRFRRACDGARERGVSVVVLIVGRSEKGQRAALAHSGSLATDERVADGLLRQVGAIPVRSLTEMIDVLALLSRVAPASPGRGAAVMTISGGETGLAADLAARHGIELPDLSAATQARLNQVLRTSGLTYQNPVDVALGSLLVLTDPQIYVEAARALLADPSVDFLLPRHMEQAGVYEGLTACARDMSKPMFLYTRTVYDAPPPGEASSPLVLPDIELCFAAVGQAISHLSERESRAGSAAPAVAAPARGPVALPPAPHGLILEDQAFRLLADIGLVTPELRVLGPGADVTAEIAPMTGPFIAKIRSHEIVHRRSAGGVRANLTSADEVEAIVRDFHDRFGAAISGVIVERMMHFDVELFVGAKRNGPDDLAIMLGLGGTFVEDMQRIGIRISPLTAWDARDVLAESGAAAAIARVAGEGAAAASARLEAIVLAFDDLCRGCGPDLVEFDVNPLGYSSRTNEFCALDAKIVLSSGKGT